MTMYRFKGKGYVPGVPARDLNEDEAKRYGMTDSPFYVRDAAARATTKKETAEPDTTPEEKPADAAKEGV